MSTIYTFPAILSFDTDGINISFPDIEEAFTCAETEEEAINNAQEVLELVLVGMEQDGVEVPKPTKLSEVKCAENERTILVTVYMAAARANVKAVYMNKTLTVPKWLNELAVKKKINFSQLLQEALKDALNIKTH
nr:type II toxin-antitoxin system HicB family antitoxin [Clostridium chromiireducens]